MATDKISKLLNSYHYQTLPEMAQAAGLKTTSKSGKDLRKADLIAKMQAEFFTKSRIQNSWKKLNERERTVMNRLLLHEGTIAKRTFQRELIRAGLATKASEQEKPKQRYSYYRSGVPYDSGDYVGRPTRPNSLVFEDIIARLTYHGLVFSRGTPLTSNQTPYKIQFHPASTIYVPDFVRRYLPEPEPLPPRLVDWQPKRTETGDPALLLRDMYLYWDFARRGEINLLQSGLVGKRALKAINKILLIPDRLLANASREDKTGRLYLLHQLLEACGLVHADEQHPTDSRTLRPVEQDPSQMLEFWKREQVEQLTVCLKAWPSLKGVKELKDEADKYSPLYRQARQMVLGALNTLRPGAWIEIDEALEQMQAQNLDFLFSEHSRVENYRGSRYYSYSYGYYRKSSKALLGELESLEFEFLNNCMTGFLYQIGVVELGYDGDTLVGFRLTPVGRAVMGLESDEQPQDEAGKLIIQPSFQLLAMGPVSLALLAQLDTFAERERAGAAAFEYRLSRDSVYEAQQVGMEASEVIRFLEQHADTDLPQNVRRSLEEWAARHERIVFRTSVSLLQAADADLLAALTDEPRTGKHLARSVTNEASLIGNGRRKQLIAALVEQGLFPAISDAQPESADRSVAIHQDGTIHPIHAVPSFHLRGRLSRLAEETGDGSWALTSSSVRRAGGSKRKVMRLLDELTKLHRGSFPAQLVERLKAWGNYYGDASAETLTLIEFRDQAALEELRQHAELQEYLLPFSSEKRALAVVPEERLAQVKEILARFGVRVTEGL
ncbi:MAG: helicase-associated domain-containing protein [Chloroflexota bacterium]|nr:helicase-associated domain-containing protein [Chloroflexota bacterium]